MFPLVFFQLVNFYSNLVNLLILLCKYACNFNSDNNLIFKTISVNFSRGKKTMFSNMFKNMFNWSIKHNQWVVTYFMTNYTCIPIHDIFFIVYQVSYLCGNTKTMVKHYLWPKHIVTTRRLSKSKTVYYISIYLNYSNVYLDLQSTVSTILNIHRYPTFFDFE